MNALHLVVVEKRLHKMWCFLLTCHRARDTLKRVIGRVPDMRPGPMFFKEERVFERGCIAYVTGN